MQHMLRGRKHMLHPGNMTQAYAACVAGMQHMLAVLRGCSICSGGKAWEVLRGRKLCSVAPCVCIMVLTCLWRRR
jgi:hypothetical protein